MKPRLFAGSVAAVALAAAFFGLSSAPADALPLPVTTAQAVAGEAPLVGVHYTGWRHRHRHYRHVRYYRPDPGLAVAGAALGLLGAVAARPRYYDYPYYYGGYYPASYGYYPAYSYGYGYPYYGYRYRRAYWGGGWGGGRSAIYGGHRWGGWGGGAGQSVVYGRWYGR